jgi:DNA-binding transcriptional MerR regulator
VAPPPEGSDEDAPSGIHAGVGYTIDDLSAMTGVPSRTIRFYQAKGALPSPTRRGRIAYYDERHVERLKLVARMQDRGLSLRAIRDLFERTDGGDVSVAEWLGVGDRLRAPWTDDHSRIVSESELGEMLGPEMRPGLIGELVRNGLIRREEGGRPDEFLVPSTGMLQIALQLDAAGVTLETAEAAHGILRRRLSRAADELADYFINRAGLNENSPESVSRSLEALRTMGIDAVRLVFAQEIERALRTMVEEGRAIPPRRKRR